VKLTNVGLPNKKNGNILCVASVIINECRQHLPSAERRDERGHRGVGTGTDVVEGADRRPTGRRTSMLSTLLLLTGHVNHAAHGIVADI